MAMLPAPRATAFGPTATLSTPAADESASVEFVWKYLMPPPFTMLFTVLLMFVTLPLRFATLLLVFDRLFETFETLFETLFTFASSDCNWLTFTASVAFRPAATFVMRRSAPAAPTDTSPPAAVAAEIAVPPTGVKPAVASVAEFATEFEPRATEFAVVAEAAPPIATAFVPVSDESASVEFAWKYLTPPPFTMLFTVLLMLVTLPLRFATLLLVFDRLFRTFETFMFGAYSGAPFTASVLDALRSPAVTPVSVRVP